MARGVPVVSSRGTALDEGVGEAALRLDARDETGWAAALLRLAADDAERERLREAGRSRAGAFDWARSARAYVDAYHDAA
jgi:alpha-1,3-rhamnosyl/mannosyltransferase